MLNEYKFKSKITNIIKNAYYLNNKRFTNTNTQTKYLKKLKYIIMLKLKITKCLNVSMYE